MAILLVEKNEERLPEQPHINGTYRRFPLVKTGSPAGIR